MNHESTKTRKGKRESPVVAQAEFALPWFLHFVIPFFQILANGYFADASGYVIF